MISAQVRVSVAIGWCSVGCPAGMTDTDVGILDWVLLKLLNQN